METSLKTGFAQIFSCCPKNLSCPNFGGAAAPLAPPARTPMVILKKSVRSFQVNVKRHNEIRDYNSKVYSPDPEEKVTNLCYTGNNNASCCDF